MFKSVRHLSPRACDRVSELVGEEDIRVELSMISVLAQVKPNSAKEKLNELLCKLEKKFAKNRFNLILKGIPDEAPLRDTGEVEVIGYQHMRDTLSQFGTLTDIQIVRGHVYVKFADQSSCVMCHNTINKMMIGDSIVTSVCVN
jgi:hypothetical protein